MKNEKPISNPALQPLEVLIGEWETTGSHPMVPGVELHGRVTFEWIEGGAFMKMHSEIDDERFPTGTAIIGSDNEAGKMFMLYFDDRGVSRKQDFEFKGNQWKWWREHPGFDQRFTVEIVENGNKMVSKGEMRRDGSNWEDDLCLTYIRVK